MKTKLKNVLAGHSSGIKGSDFPNEWAKAVKTPLKDTYMKLGFKKLNEFIKACPDVITVEEKGGGNIVYHPKKK